MAGVAFIGYWRPADTKVICCTHVIEGAPAALIAHHRDGDVQVLCDRKTHTKDEAGFVALDELLFLVPELADAPTISPGEWALRDGLDPWRVERNPED